MANSVKVRPGRYFRRHLRMEKVARLEASGMFTNNQIAEMIGVSLPTLHQIKAQPEYLNKRAELAAGVVNDLHMDLRVNEESLRNEIVDMLPGALSVIRNVITKATRATATPQDLKLGMDAAKEVLDREGTFAKVSRSEIKVEEIPNFSEAEAVETNLLTMLQQANEGKAKNAAGETVTVDLSSFVSASGDRESQERMKQFINLTDFDSKTIQ